MKSVFFNQVLKCIALDSSFSTVGLPPPSPPAYILTFAEPTGFFFYLAKSVIKQRDFSKAYFTTFATSCASHCLFPPPQLAQASGGCALHILLNDLHWAPGFHLNWGSLCLLRVWHSTLSTHKGALIERHKQASILVVKLVWALWLRVSHVFFFSFLFLVSVQGWSM